VKFAKFANSKVNRDGNIASYGTSRTPIEQAILSPFFPRFVRSRAPDDLMEDVGPLLMSGETSKNRLFAVELLSNSVVTRVRLRGDLRAGILAGGKRLWYDNDITYAHARRKRHTRSRVDS
jgi:hypothetical protein